MSDFPADTPIPGNSMSKRSKFVFLPLALFALLAPTIGFANSASALHYSDYFKWHVLMFDTPLAAFDSLAKDPAHRPSGFDWTTDLCSAPGIGSTGITFDFSAACRRHDFGYRNLRSYSLATSPDMRKAIDLQFRDDLRGSCAKRSLWQRPTCYGWSETFYRVVRLVAGT